MDQKTVENINTLGSFCGIRDVEALKPQNLLERYAIPQADVMVLFGGSILAGGDVFANAIKDNVAGKTVIVGGVGHTTQTLRQLVCREYPEIMAAERPEAEIFQDYLRCAHGCEADFLETESTNCGNNITYLLKLLQDKGVTFKSMILCQDASMQRRMDAGLRKYGGRDLTIINYAAYCAKVCLRGDTPVYAENIHGMWTIDRYVDLLMGEIPRLTDDGKGYGPNGKRFIAHVDIPEKVRLALEELKHVYGDKTREANPLYSSKNANGGHPI